MAKKQNNTNDDKIIALKAKIAEKKEALAAAKSFRPLTNCSLDTGSGSVNIRTADADRLTEMLVKVNALRLSAEDLGVQYKVSGFTPADWLTDLRSLLTQVNRREEEKNLKTMEDYLHSLLSSEKKVELAIDEIEKMI